MAVDWKDVGLKSLTGVIVLGALIMYFSSSVFGLQVLNDNCKIELTTGDGGEDENAGWKEFMDVTAGVGAAPMVLLIMYLFVKFSCNGNNMTFAAVLSLLVGGMAVGVSYTPEESVRYGMIGLISGVVILAALLGVKQPTTPQAYLIRLSAAGVLLFGGAIACASAGIGKYTECQERRGCTPDEDGEMPLCDASCSNPPTEFPCGSCTSCDQHQGVQDKLWIINGVSIGACVLSIAGIVVGAYI